MPFPSSRPVQDVDALAISTFFDVSLDLLVIRERDGRTVRVSPSWETTLGWRADEMEGAVLLDLLHPDDLAATLESVIEVETRGPDDLVTGMTNRYRHKNGGYRTLEWRARRVGDRIYGVARDVTEKVAAERALIEAKTAAETANRAKSDFLANMSHEIRTPLNGVLGVAALMERELTQEAMRPYARTILDSGQSLLRLLTDALDMSRAEAGLMTFEAAPVHLAAVAADLKALWSPRAQEKSLTLTVTHDTAAHDWVAGDEMRLKQLFNNLIGNALKFTGSGEVAVHIASEELDGAIALTATVDDSGPGVPAEAAGSIFDPFNTGHAGREGAGAGLGLAICRQIVELMSGSIAVERSPQGGARFRFSLRLPGSSREMRAAATQMAAPTDHTTLHVLVVDDNATNRFVAGKVLELFGCSSEAVEDGRQAVDRVQSGAFDLILMDIKMPVMDGVQATRLIRNLPGPVADLPILALTANADPRDEAEYLAAGMNGVAQKPIQPDALLNAIRLVMSSAPPLEQTLVTRAA